MLLIYYCSQIGEHIGAMLHNNATSNLGQSSASIRKIVEMEFKTVDGSAFSKTISAPLFDFSTHVTDRGDTWRRIGKERAIKYNQPRRRTEKDLHVLYDSFTRISGLFLACQSGRS
jgi:hypothetical protein